MTATSIRNAPARSGGRAVPAGGPAFPAIPTLATGGGSASTTPVRTATSRGEGGADPLSAPIVGVIDSGIHPGHPHIGTVVDGAAFDGDGRVLVGADCVDRLGHGTAVAAAIQDLAPAVRICPLQVFHQRLDAPVAALAAAIDRAARQGLPLVNLSLGTADRAHADTLAAAVARAHAAGVVIVAAGADAGVAWLPGVLPLDGLLRAELDWTCPRGVHTTARAVASAYADAASGSRPPRATEASIVSNPQGRPVFRTCGYPRPIPGVDPARNLKGLSFAVANLTGIAARALTETGAQGHAALTAELQRRARRP